MTGLAAAAFLAVVHLAAGRIPAHDERARSRWLSLAGGVSVAFVFMILLPELAASHRVLNREAAGSFVLLQRDAYLLALLGVLAFYGLDRVMILGRARRHPGGRGSVGTALFWAHITAFALYNALIGYVIAHGGNPEIGNLSLFTIAVALHFTANDHAMRSHHRREYDRVGRWILAPAPLLGWLLGSLLRVGDLTLSLLLAFLAGGIVLNVLKEELPEERESCFLPFAIGAVAYAMLVLLV
jgi:zinc transporter ZupT